MMDTWVLSDHCFHCFKSLSSFYCIFNVHRLERMEFSLHCCILFLIQDKVRGWRVSNERISH